MALRGSVVPLANEELAGVTAIETRVGAPTVRAVEPEMDPEVAMMVAIPAATPLASPDGLTVAIPEADEFQSTLAVRS